MTAPKLSSSLPTGEQTTTINGVRLFWERTGDSGEPLVLVHGSWVDHHNWDAMAHSANAQRAGSAREWRLRHWLQRFLPAELLAGLAAAMCASVADALSGDDLLIVAASIIGSAISYYGFIVIREIVEAQRAYRAMHVRFTRHATLVTIRTLALEFGSAELLDSLLFSPVMLHVFVQTVSNLQLAVLLGEVASSVTFYITLRVTREVRRTFADTAHMPTHRPII